ncbi:unnamed protein product [Darwinula stevensoni]|uniref:Cell division cycle protein 27 homolog n=1 Tax=Darwinula stevensoni TaxID=69355 RepID=A0A7R8ZXW7_9CRUS|nr:unnamed protein product [Darwinula stevensoni]CAG0880265.1 unnamed protein product [Darwinula stevensoni]
MSESEKVSERNGFDASSSNHEPSIPKKPPDLNQDDLILEQQAKIEKEIAAFTPLVGEKEKLSVKMAEEYHSDQVYSRKIDDLQTKYGYIRRTRGDGNCFYRAFAYSYFENLLQDSKELARFQEVIKKTKEDLMHMGFPNFTVEDFYETFEDVLEKIGSKISPDELHSIMNDTGTSDYLVVYLRLITSCHLQKEAAFFENFLEGDITMKDFCSHDVEPMFRESDHIHIIALTSAVKVGVRVEYMDRGEGGKVNAHDFPNSSTNPQHATWNLLNNHAIADSIFMAERLLAESKTEENTFLLASCFYRGGRPDKAHLILSKFGGVSPHSRYLLAKCYLELDRLNDSESVIQGGGMKNRNLEDVINEYGDLAPFVLQILGQIYARTERENKAIEAYRKAIKLNPLLWTCFQALCNLGVDPEPSKVFQLPSLDTGNSIVTCQKLPVHQQHLHQHIMDPSAFSTPEFTSVVSSAQGTPSSPLQKVSPDIITSNQNNVNAALSVYHSSIKTSNSSKKQKQVRFAGLTSNIINSPGFTFMTWDTPGSAESTQHPIFGTLSGGTPFDNKQTQQQAQQQLPIRKDMQLLQLGSGKSVLAQTGNTVPTPSGPVKITQPQIRRSSRLFSSSNSVKENNKASAKSRLSKINAPTKKIRTRSSKNENKNENENELEGIIDEKPETIMLDGKDLKPPATVHLSRYHCSNAIEVLNALPHQHFQTGWVLSAVGRAYFEMAKYKEAIKYFEEQREVAPYHLEGLEHYSTGLWHLQNEKALAALASSLLSTWKKDSQSYCAAGNCFSLQKEHETAIKFFQRAVQVSPRCAYAYAQLGHEYVLIDALEKALRCFQSAISIDKRSYTAWYGIGVVFFKQERFQLAEYYYRKALEVNPYNPTLLCHLGVTQHSRGQYEKALKTLEDAVKQYPGHVLCRYHYASTLVTLERLAEALEELQLLRQQVPRESLVCFLMGKVYSQMGNAPMALAHVSWAMDLDPKGVNIRVREGIEPNSRIASEDIVSPAGLSCSSGTEGMVESFGSLTPSTPLGVDQMRLVEGENSAQSRGAGAAGPSVGEDEEDREQPGSLQGELAIVSAACTGVRLRRLKGSEMLGMRTCQRLLPPPSLLSSKELSKPLFGWLNAIFNMVDESRIKEVGADRACAEWLLRCGAYVRWKEYPEKWVSDYNTRPCLNDAGGLKHVEEVKFHRCSYLDDESLPMLKPLAETLTSLEIVSCGNVTDRGLASLGQLRNLKTMFLFDLPAVKDREGCLRDLERELPSCRVEFPSVEERSKSPE